MLPEVLILYGSSVDWEYPGALKTHASARAEFIVPSRAGFASEASFTTETHSQAAHTHISAQRIVAAIVSQVSVFKNPGVPKGFRF